MTRKRHHAVVLGGSIGGLLAARTLCDHFERVTIIERDKLPQDSAARKGVPQGRHLHGLLAGGLRALEEMFPDFSVTATERGAIPVDVGNFGAFYVKGQKILPVETGLRGLLMSRPLIELHVRELLLTRPNVTILDACRASALMGTAERVSGVRIEPAGAAAEELAAELVIDATGRGSRMTTWLEVLGVKAPHEESVCADVLYSSCIIRRKPEHLGGKPSFIISPAASGRRFGAALAIEDQCYIITTTSYLGEPGATDYASLTEFMRSLPVPDLYELLCDAEPLTETVQLRDKASRRRRYERLSSFPEGLLVFGDALCSFNPAYGQGMTVAALEARALDRCLRKATRKLAPRFFRAAARIVDAPWSIAVGGDFEFAGVQGSRPLLTPLLNPFFRRVVHKAAVDAAVANALWRVLHLVDPPRALLSPALLARVLRPGGASVPRHEVLTADVSIKADIPSA